MLNQFYIHLASCTTKNVIWNLLCTITWKTVICIDFKVKMQSHFLQKNEMLRVHIVKLKKLELNFIFILKSYTMKNSISNLLCKIIQSVIS